MSDKDYDQALLIQKLKRIASYSPLDDKKQWPAITSEQVEQASWEVMWDLEVAIEQQNPTAMEKAKKIFHDELLPRICAALENEGFHID